MFLWWKVTIKSLSSSGTVGHFFVVLKLQISRGSARRVGKSISAKIRIYKCFVFQSWHFKRLYIHFNFCMTRTLFSSTVTYLNVVTFNTLVHWKFYVNRTEHNFCSTFIIYSNKMYEKLVRPEYLRHENWHKVKKHNLTLTFLCLNSIIIPSFFFHLVKSPWFLQCFRNKETKEVNWRLTKTQPGILLTSYQNIYLFTDHLTLFNLLFSRPCP